MLLIARRFTLSFLIMGLSSCITLVARELPMEGKEIDVMIDTIQMDYSQFNVGQWVYTPKSKTDQFVVAEMTFTNVGSTMQILDPSLFQIHGPAGEMASPTLIFSVGALGNREQLFKKDRLGPSEKIRRTVVFAFPVKTRPERISHPEFGNVVIPLQVKPSSQPTPGY